MSLQVDKSITNSHWASDIKSGAWTKSDTYTGSYSEEMMESETVFLRSSSFYKYWQGSLALVTLLLVKSSHRWNTAPVAQNGKRNESQKDEWATWGLFRESEGWGGKHRNAAAGLTWLHLEFWSVQGLLLRGYSRHWLSHLWSDLRQTDEGGSLLWGMFSTFSSKVAELQTCS